MDEACSDHEPFAIEKMNEELAEACKPRKKRHDDSFLDLPDYYDDSQDYDGLVTPYGMLTKPQILQHVNNIIAESEVRRRKSIKKRRRATKAQAGQRGPDELRVDDTYDPDDENYNVIVDYSDDATVLDPIEAIELIKKKEKVEVASWLLVSSVRGGWTYERVKCYLKQKYGIQSVMSQSETRRLGVLEYDNFFQAVVKFYSEWDLIRIFNDLVVQKMQDKFVFFSFVDMPVTFYDSDSEDDEPRVNPWIENPDDVYIVIPM